MNPKLVSEIMSVAERLGWVLLHSLWQGCLIAVLLVIALWFARGRAAALRHLLCLMALTVMLGAVTATAWRMSTQVPVKPLAPSGQTEGAGTGTGALAMIPDPQEPSVLSPDSAPARSNALSPEHSPASAAATPTPKAYSANGGESALERYLPWIGAGWMLGVVLLSIRHLGGWWHVRALRRGTQTARPPFVFEAIRVISERLGISRSVSVHASNRVSSPMLAGVLKPVILLPASLLTGLRRSDIEAILAHELAHFARWDSWTNLFQIFVETILFYHPAIWWISNRARIERENAADDLAIRALREDRVSYAHALARLAELEHEAQALAVAANDGSILSRLRRVVRAREETEPAGAGWLVAGVIALLCLTFVPLHAQENRKIIKVNAGQPLQAAIDAAEPGSTIQLEEGEWKERLVITKPLTLEGAGWEKTIIKPDQPPPGATPEAKAEFRKKYFGQTSPEIISAFRREWLEKFAPPTVLVKNVQGVSLRALRIGGIAQSKENEAGDDPLVIFESAKADMVDCAVVGPYGDGIDLTAQSVVEVRRSLIAAMWRMGIAVQGTRGPQGKASTLRLTESEIRNIYTYGISIGSGCDDTLIDRCRISGTAWHGIRYDDASPTITGNAISKHARSAIYASGHTKATVKGNLFWRNEMSGISCWFNNQDRIEGNTFVGNLRESLAVLGGSKPTIERNLFATSPVAVSCGRIADSESKSMGEPVLVENWYWDTPVTLGKPDAEKDPSAPKVGEDPMFMNAREQDFTLAADSPVRAAKIGVAEPLSMKGPWPLLAEEKAMIPDEDTFDYRYWGKAGGKNSKKANDAARKAFEDAKAWVADAFQLEDKGKREAAIEKVRAAMSSDKPDEARTGLTAFTQLGPIEFDKASFRPLVRNLVRSSDVATRSAAVNAFTMTGVDPEDLPVIYALADDQSPEVRDQLAFVIFRVNEGDLTSKGASDAIMKLIAKMPRDPRSIAHSIWGAKLSPEIEAKVLEICKDIPYAQGPGYDFFYGTLSTQANKSEASVKRLIELLAHQDTTNIAGRSAWGLQQGVAEAQYPLLADAMVQVIEARSDGYLRNNAIRCLQRYGTAAQAPALKALLAKPGTTGELRKNLESTLAEIEARPAPAAAAPQ